MARSLKVRRRWSITNNYARIEITHNPSGARSPNMASKVYTEAQHVHGKK